MAIDARQIYVMVESFRNKIDLGRSINLSVLSRNYDHALPSSRRKAIELSNAVNCNYHTISEIINTITSFYLYYHHGSIWNYLNEKNIKHCNRTYFPSYRLNKDKSLIETLNAKKGFKSVDEYFKIGEDGLCPASVLLDNKYIGPDFYMEHLDCLSQIDNSNAKQSKITQVMKEKKRWHVNLIGI